MTDSRLAPEDERAALKLSRLPTAEVFAKLASSPDGLTAEDAEARRRREGPNALPGAVKRSVVRELVAQFVHFFALLLWIAAALAFFAGTPQLAVAIAIVVVVNGLFSFLQEYRAERLTRSLQALLPRRATVLRGGRRLPLGAEDVVRGDVLLLREGDRVPADARLFSADGLAVDLSMLTGESEAIPRTAEPAAPPPTLAEVGNFVLAGSFVVEGFGRAVVVATGERTAIARLSRSAQTVVRRPTPLKLELAHAVRLIAFVSLAAGGLFFAASAWRGVRTHDALIFAVGVIVALVPEGLLPTLTLSLAMSAGRMAKRRALVKRLDAVETLGAVTVICADKTGTMTAHELTARVARVGEMQLIATGVGFGPEGTLLSGDRPLHEREQDAVRPMLRVAALCGDASLHGSNGQWTAHGDPTDAALLVFARKGGVERHASERQAPRVAEFPFDPRRRRMSTLHRLPDGSFELACKGSPEAVLEACVARWDGTRTEPLDERLRAGLARDADALARNGYRVLALARRRLAEAPGSGKEAERALELVGLVGLSDPVRPEVPEAVASCRRAGIRVVMVTGDHPATALAVARAAGLEASEAVLGSELPDGDEALGELLQHTSVLARAAPEQKLRIARALQARGEVVAMTGDGVNDAPALRQADVGVAMGLTGTDVARDAADLVLLDDHFAQIVFAVEEGRAAFANIRRFLTYHLTDNVSELAPFVVWALGRGAFPLLISVLQILALDIGTDLLPALALGAEPPDPSTMDQPPRRRREPLFDRAVLLRAFGFLGPLQAALCLGAGLLAAHLLFGWRFGRAFPTLPGEVAILSATVFTAVVLAQVANAFECRDPRRGVGQLDPSGNRLLNLAACAEVGLLCAFLYLPSLSRALGNGFAGPLTWALAAAAAVLFLVGEEARKAWLRARARRSLLPRSVPLAPLMSRGTGPQPPAIPR